MMCSCVCLWFIVPVVTVYYSRHDAISTYIKGSEANILQDCFPYSALSLSLSVYLVLPSPPLPSPPSPPLPSSIRRVWTSTMTAAVIPDVYCCLTAPISCLITTPQSSRQHQNLFKILQVFGLDEPIFLPVSFTCKQLVWAQNIYLSVNTCNHVKL